MTALIKIYNKHPITFTRGEGVWLYDDNDEQYLDALSGIGVCALGHHHPAITNTITQQAKKLLHVANIFYTEPQVALAKKLCEMSGLDKALFSNSGTEAVEAAIKMARLYGTRKGIASPKIIVMNEAFHGRTLGSWSASGPQGMQFGPLLSGFIPVPFNDVDAIEGLSKDKDIVAIILEPILGKKGCLPANPGVLKKIRKLCDANDWLMILDEIQSGMGRTGKLFAYEHENILPDIVTTAKALGNGIPIGTYVASKKASDIFQPGDHGSTQAGNAFACAVGLSVLNTFENENIFENVTYMGTLLNDRLSEALESFELFERVQGKGLMIGIKLKAPVNNAIEAGIANRILFNHAGKDVIRLLPPYIVTEAHVDEIVRRMKETFELLVPSS
ncbi:MAG: aspartate aminotransferase family protein [Gammaproteobacteria bacterium]